MTPGRYARYFREFDFLLGPARRRLPFVVFLILVSAGLDLLGVALVGPLVLLVSNDGSALPGASSALLGPLRAFDRSWLIPAVGLSMVVVVCLRGIAGYRVQKTISSFGDEHRAELMNRLLAAYLRKPLGFHTARGPSQLLNVVMWHTSAFSGLTLAASLRALTDGIVLGLLGLLLAYTNLLAVCSLAVILGTTSVVIHRFVRPRLTHATKESARQNGAVIAGVTQCLSGLREIRVLGCEDFFEGELRSAARRLANANASSNALAVIPRFSIEAAIVLFLVVVALSSVGTSSPAGATGVTTTLAVFAAAAVRLMPASTSFLGSINSLRAARPVIGQLYSELCEAEGGGPTVQFASETGSITPFEFQSLELRNVGFSYATSTEPVLEGLDLRIDRGQCIGLMGRSGVGKSTLADIVLGFLDATSGTLLVNGDPLPGALARWRGAVAYIPQSPLVLDASFRQNIALGQSPEQVDDSRLWRAIEFAQLGDVVRGSAEGLDTVVGEKGARLSGGQRQRVALARALYFDRQFIVLDEATSALDEETESQVVKTLVGLRGEKTLLVIAHRKSTLTACTQVYRLDRTAEGSRLTALRETVDESSLG